MGQYADFFGINPSRNQPALVVSASVSMTTSSHVSAFNGLLQGIRGGEPGSGSRRRHYLATWNLWAADVRNQLTPGMPCSIAQVLATHVS